MNYWERYSGDYARDTAHLSLAGHGAYGLMLDTYYATERPLPSPYDSLYRICRATGKCEQEAVRVVADEFFPILPDGLRHNARADAEIAKAKPRIIAARANGKGGGRKKNPVGYPPGTQQEPSGLPNGNPPGIPPATQPPTQPGEAFHHAPHTTHQEQKRGPRKRDPETPLPEPFEISERVRRWAEEKGHSHLAERLEHFVSKAKAKGYVYVDWDEAFMEAIRKDWAELDGKPSGAMAKLTPAGQKTAAALASWMRDEEPHGAD